MQRFFTNSSEANEGGNIEGGFDGMADAGIVTDKSAFNNSRDSSFGLLEMNNKKTRYSDAYGDYMGGYSPGGGFSPRPLMRGPQPQMPRPLMGPMGPPGPPRPPRLWMRHYGPGLPSRRNFEDDKAIRFLTRCGVGKEHLKNLPHDLLMLIQSEHCGLCDIEFESFSLARVHYVSKKHLKNQKKWLSKSSGSQPGNEMKARELYCELCDVEITSKAHGDAHYEGKPHRGIVEGRKKPRNPMLLQSNMEQRVELLIRREKRALKAAKDTTSTEGVVGAPKEAKATSSLDLYCHICKSTSTCTEQLTMHLNGKKHLSKEKRHILSMMMGKKEDENEEKEEDNMDKDEDGEETQTEGVAEVKLEVDDKGAGDDDWGTESWDNQDKPQTAA